MNWERFKGNWLRLKVKVKEKWDHLTDDEISRTGGDRDRLAGLLLEKYGLSRAAAECELTEIYRQAERELEEIQEQKFDARF